MSFQRCYYLKQRLYGFRNILTILSRGILASARGSVNHRNSEAFHARSRKGIFMVWKVQLAFQGGGSRFIQHLAVASAFQELEREKIVQISRVSGTSAGSLAAAIIASGRSSDLAAEFIIQNRESYLKKLSSPRNWRMVTRFIKGEPLLDISALQVIFEQVWNNLCGDRITKFRHLEKPLSVIATDMVSRKPVVFEEPDQDIIEALIHSCAIPFVYRGLNDILRKQPLVDGGLVENLPLSGLVEGRTTYGDVVAITFKEANTLPTPKTHIEYINCLFNIAISNNVERVKNLINKRHIFEIQTNIEPLDFKAAIEDFGTSSNFHQLRDKALEWGRKNARSFDQQIYGPNAVPITEEPSSVMMMKYVNQIFEAQHKNSKYFLRRKSIVVTAYSLLKKLNVNDRRADLGDEVSQYTLIDPDREPVHCIPFRLDVSAQYSQKMQRSVTVTAQDGTPITPIVVPTKGLDNIGDANHIEEALIFFEPVLLPTLTSMYPIKIRSFALIDGAMSDLANNKTDYLSLRNWFNSNIQTAEIVLAVPRQTHT